MSGDGLSSERNLHGSPGNRGNHTNGISGDATRRKELVQEKHEKREKKMVDKMKKRQLEESEGQRRFDSGEKMYFETGEEFLEGEVLVMVLKKQKTLLFCFSKFTQKIRFF